MMINTNMPIVQESNNTVSSFNNIDTFINSDFAKNLQLTYGLDAGIFRNIIADLFEYLSTGTVNVEKNGESKAGNLLGQFDVDRNNTTDMENLKNIQDNIKNDVVQHIAISNYMANGSISPNLFDVVKPTAFISGVNKNLLSKLFYKSLNVNLEDATVSSEMKGVSSEIGWKGTYEMSSNIEKFNNNEINNASTKNFVGMETDLLQNSFSAINLESEKVTEMSAKNDIKNDVNNVNKFSVICEYVNNVDSRASIFSNGNGFLEIDGLKNISGDVDSDLLGKRDGLDKMGNSYMVGSSPLDNLDVSDRGIDVSNDNISSSHIKVVKDIANIINNSIEKLSTSNHNEINLKVHLTSSDVVSVEVKLNSNVVNVNIDTNNANIGQFISSNVDVLRNNLYTNNFSLGTVSVNVSGSFTNTNDGYRRERQPVSNEYGYINNHTNSRKISVPKVRNLEVIV